MGSNRLRSWHGGVTGVSLWMLLATVAAIELYDEVPLESEPSSFQDTNYLDTGPVESQKREDLALAKDVLLYRLIQSLQNKLYHAKPNYRPDWPKSYQEPQHDLGEMTEKDGVVKRLSNALRGSERNLPFRNMDTYRPQQKWKIKKGKSLGTQMVCYFKLCAFRSPV